MVSNRLNKCLSKVYNLSRKNKNETILIWIFLDSDRINSYKQFINLIPPSRKIGIIFRENEIKIDQVLSSQWCRCKDTARYAFKNFEEFPALNSTFSPPYDKKEKKQIKELKNFVQNWSGKGGNLVLVTHYVVITAVTSVAPSSGEMVITDKNFNVLTTINTF